MIVSSVGSTHAGTTGFLARTSPPTVVPRQTAVAGEISTTQQSLLDALAPLVGMTTDELQSTLAAGQPLESLAAQYGIDLKALSEKLETTTGILLDVKA